MSSNLSMMLSSPNRMISEYFKCLRRLVYHIANIKDVSEQKQYLTLCVFMAVSSVEAFLNIYFRIIVSEDEYSKHKQRVLKDLKSRKPLYYKLKNWPEDILGKTIDFQSDTLKRFDDLRNLRNKLMHFTSSHESIVVPGTKISIVGLADTSAYDSLTSVDEKAILGTAEGIVQEIFRLRGIPEIDIPYALQLWTGRVVI